MLRAEGLSHAFGPVRALDDISFTLSAGQTLAIFGPNGAGKTTLLKALAGLLRPRAGRAEVEGGRRAIGWIGHQSHLYGHLSVLENVLFWASLYGVTGPAARRRADELMRDFGLSDAAHTAVRALSRGQVQRAAIVRALMHDPRVLLLDEPFTGLDLVAAAELRRWLAAWAGGRVIVLVTHNVEEGAELASDIAFMRHGRFLRLEPRAGRPTSAIAAAYREAVAGA